MTVFVVSYFDTRANDYFVDSLWYTLDQAGKQRRKLEDEDESLNVFVDEMQVRYV
jgi:hypothetical protein